VAAIIDPAGPGRVSGVLRENFHARPARSMMGPRDKDHFERLALQFRGPLTTSLAICPPVAISSTVMSAVSRNLAWDSALPSRGVSPRACPKIAPPCFANFAIASARPSSWRNCNCVVLSPGQNQPVTTFELIRRAHLCVSHPAAPAFPHALLEVSLHGQNSIFNSFTPHSLCARRITTSRASTGMSFSSI